MAFIYFLIGIMFIIGLVLLLQAAGAFKTFDLKRRNLYGKKKTPSVLECIDVLDGNFDELAKTEAIFSLLHSSYFFVQTQGNEGNNYDDKAQSALFNQLLTPSAVKCLSELEGRNGQYSF